MQIPQGDIFIKTISIIKAHSHHFFYIKLVCTSLIMETLLYQKIHHIISLIPSGKVATYGQIAEIVGGCTARMVGYAASAVPQDSDIPWQRVINYKGGISQRSSGTGGLRQQKLLEAEGIEFDQYGRTNLKHFRWKGE